VFEFQGERFSNQRRRKNDLAQSTKRCDSYIYARSSSAVASDAESKHLHRIMGLYGQSMAKLYIRNGGDPFSLQQILEHSSLEMVQTYVLLWNNEIREQHNRFSPLEHIEPQSTDNILFCRQIAK